MLDQAHDIWPLRGGGIAVSGNKAVFSLQAAAEAVVGNPYLVFDPFEFEYAAETGTGLSHQAKEIEWRALSEDPVEFTVRKSGEEYTIDVEGDLRDEDLPKLCAELFSGMMFCPAVRGAYSDPESARYTVMGGAVLLSDVTFGGNALPDRVLKSDGAFVDLEEPKIEEQSGAKVGEWKADGTIV